MNISNKFLCSIVEPYNSEKSTMISNKYNQYTFRVQKFVSKKEIKKSIESIFSVKVKKVSMINIKGKVKIFKRIRGKRSNWKKVYVSLDKKHSIDFSFFDKR
ncbi:50S ribosomal protein L23 [Candidatus Legionella polyplacis]|uniref:50S ribosomal protein L23 n=1 Tax=Candidatus Legionella polyplacis TaxID=2005262 RepID=UPI000C1E782E|nr:50S ribosomal protein L23 [Candidatus Legionella polyplacis]ATW01764.1 50S ribosomal protein L23 [Candidatus Legionella polyplacis]